MSRAWWRIRRADSRRRAMRSLSARGGAVRCGGGRQRRHVRVSFSIRERRGAHPPGGRARAVLTSGQGGGRSGRRGARRRREPRLVASRSMPVDLGLLGRRPRSPWSPGRRQAEQAVAAEQQRRTDPADPRRTGSSRAAARSRRRRPRTGTRATRPRCGSWSGTAPRTTRPGRRRACSGRPRRRSRTSTTISTAEPVLTIRNIGIPNAMMIEQPRGRADGGRPDRRPGRRTGSRRSRSRRRS